MTDPTSSVPSMPIRGRFAVNDPNWYFQLQGNDFWLHGFHMRSLDVDVFADHEDDKPTVYFFASPHLTGLSAPEATSRAQQLLVLFNGALQLSDGVNFKPFTLGMCIDRSTNSRAYVPYGNSPPMSAFPADVHRLRYLPRDFPLDGIGTLLFYARSDPYVLAILRILGTHGITLGSLSQVLDTVKGAMHAEFKKEKELLPVLAAYGKKELIDLYSFTYTANNYAVSEVNARHGYDEKMSITQKLRALSLGEAADIVLSCATGFFRVLVENTYKAKIRDVVVMSRGEAN